MSDERAYKRDASWYNHPRARSSDTDDGSGFIGKYHFANPDDPAMSACGRSPIAEFTGETVYRIDERYRCRRPGCRSRWPGSPSEGPST